MADQQIDNLYFNFEVGGNADEKLDEIDKSFENVTESVEKFEQTFTKIEVLGKILDNFREKTAKLVGEGKNLENTDLLSNLNKEFAALDRYNNELSKTKPISEADYKTAEEAIEKVSTETGRLEETLRVSKQRLAELASQGKENTTQFVNLASKIAKVEEKLLELKAASLPDLVDDKTTPGSSGVGTLDGTVAKTTPQMSRFRKILNSIINLFSKLGSDGDKAFKKIDKSTKKANNSSKNYNKGLRGLLGTAKRFLIFGTFFTIQRQISQAFSEGTQNLYQYSKAIDGKFAQSMDRLATSFLYLKNAIGAAVAPIINAVTPALESLIDTVAEFGNKLAETFAALTGATTFKKAIKSHKEYAEAVNATNNALAKFDEINNITTSKGKDELDYGSMFETAKVNLEFKNLNDFGKQLAKKLNEQISKLNKSNIGGKLGNKINDILDFGIGFIQNFEWDEASKSLLYAITDFIDNSDGDGVDWGKVGKLFSSLVVGAFDFIDGVLDWLSDTSNIDAITNGLTKFVDAIEFDKIAESFAKLFKKAIVAGVKLMFAIPDLGRSLKNAIVSGINEIIAGAIISIFGDNKFSRFLLASGKLISVMGFANGGYPESGQMFIARENGIPEMVGSIGGRTAVANNDQIVEAISIGVYNAYMDAMSRSGGNKQPTIVQINGREVFRAVQDESSSYTKRTGQPAF